MTLYSAVGLCSHGYCEALVCPKQYNMQHMHGTCNPTKALDGQNVNATLRQQLASTALILDKGVKIQHGF